MVQILEQKRREQNRLAVGYSQKKDTDGGLDAMENMFYPIEFRIKEEIGKDAKPYRAWWNNLSGEWKY
jgi:hypothetical protein